VRGEEKGKKKTVFFPFFFFFFFFFGGGGGGGGGTPPPSPPAFFFPQLFNRAKVPGRRGGLPPTRLEFVDPGADRRLGENLEGILRGEFQRLGPDGFWYDLEVNIVPRSGPDESEISSQGYEFALARVRDRNRVEREAVVMRRRPRDRDGSTL